MEESKYLYRISDKILEAKLESSGAVLVEGAKWCGKTTSAHQASKSAIYLQDPDNASSYRAMADTKPSLLLKGEKPRLLDEWQTIPVLWDAVRYDVDRSGEVGSYILTGSAVPSDNLTEHTGTGRISRMMMRTMSLFESLESNGSVSLSSLFAENIDVEGISTLTVERIAYAICRGGWPNSIRMKPNAALQVATNYTESVINMDVNRVDGVEKNPERVRLLLRSLARNISTLTTGQTILADIEATDLTISDKTLTQYLNALRRIYVIEDVPAWQPSLRSKSAIRTTHKRGFVDPSIATAVLRAKPESLLEDFQLFGFLFEALCIRDMRIYAEANDGDVFHYRDATGLESDMIIRLRNGKWGAIEVKLGSGQIDNAAKNLLELKDKINKEKMGEPSFLMVLTGGEFAYRREDGVLVVPIGCMRD